MTDGQGGARCGPAHKQAVVRACARGGSGALLLHWPPELGASSAVTWGAHVTASCRATQPSVQSSLPSGYQLPAPLRTGGLASGPRQAEQVCRTKCGGGALVARIGRSKRQRG
ncbi:PREDICTED: protein BEX3 isoform X1 [Capra hircus]|uniref:protein BEX3 isoform X1 n=1 Tax=Capra hircus TaxID=9925 RepID=UPI0008474F4C|nr:PREDICTED: protein BEX3 isoform X1 [Capra hircus]